MTEMITQTPNPPYYAVIFTSIRNNKDQAYIEMADKVEEMARTQDGFLGIEGARQSLGISVSYWKDLKSIQQWREHTEHSLARQLGR